MTGDGETSAPTRRYTREEKGKAKMCEPPAQNYNAACTKLLFKRDVDLTNARLKLTGFDATCLTGDLDLYLKPPTASGTYSKTMHVVDDHNRLYNMILSDYLRPGWNGYSVCGEWALFVRDNQLRVGDQVFFFRIPVTHCWGNYHFSIKFTRKTA